MDPDRYLLTVSGRDRPGLAGSLFAALEKVSSEITDVGQITIRGHLILCIEVQTASGSGHDELVRAVEDSGVTGDGSITVEVNPTTERLTPKGPRILVTLVAPTIDATKLAGVFSAIAICGGDVERIVRLADFPVQSYELLVRDSDQERLRAELGRVAVEQVIDIAVQRAGLHRRAKRLIVMDVDSTLLQGEVIDMLAERCGHEHEVAAITERAMAGEIDFATSLRQRVALLKGMDIEEVTSLSSALILAPGARTLLRTLSRLGYKTGVVSGGFSQVIAPLVTELGIDYCAANELEVVDGKLTGALSGPIIDRAGKATMLEQFARDAAIPLNQTVAVGDGANDIDMLSVAGLGIAFNARPIVRQAADTALSVPFLDAVLFLLGISREEIEAADAEPSD
jgi:phosphoserine phosphatase